MCEPHISLKYIVDYKHSQYFVLNHGRNRFLRNQLYIYPERTKCTFRKILSSERIFTIWKIIYTRQINQLITSMRYLVSRWPLDCIRLRCSWRCRFGKSTCHPVDSRNRNNFPDLVLNRIVSFLFHLFQQI